MVRTAFGRRLGLLTAATLGLMLAPAGLTSASASTPTVASVSVTPSIHVGGTANIVARLVRAGTSTGVAGANLAVDEIRYGLSSYYRVGLLKTDSKGYIRFSQKPVYNTRYRVRFAGTGSYARTESKASQVNVSRNITASSDKSQIYPEGESFTVSGAVSPGGQGKVVNLVRHDAGGDNVMASSTLDANSQYALTYLPNRGGTSSYSVQVPAAAGRADSLSPTFTVTVLTIHYLADEPIVQGSTNHGTANINGVAYVHSLYEALSCTTDNTSGYDLGRGSTRFRTVEGLDDSSNSAVRITFTIVADGKTVDTSDAVGIGQQRVIDLDVTGVLRLSLNWHATGVNCGNTPFKAAWGDARFYASS